MTLEQFMDMPLAEVVDLIAGYERLLDRDDMLWTTLERTEFERHLKVCLDWLTDLVAELWADKEFAGLPVLEEEAHADTE